METRFPISKDKGHVMLSFTWYDAFRASKRAEQYSIHFEKAAVMFNLGAVLTQQALACDRTQDQGMKDAAKKFQVWLIAAVLWRKFGIALSLSCHLLSLPSCFRRWRPAHVHCSLLHQTHKYGPPGGG